MKDKYYTECIRILDEGHILIDDIPGVDKTSLAISFAKAMSLDNREYVIPKDVQEAFQKIAPHRLIMAKRAISEKISAESAVEKICKGVKAPVWYLSFIQKYLLEAYYL